MQQETHQRKELLLHQVKELLMPLKPYIFKTAEQEQFFNIC
jgi:hypothetical protein